MKRFHVPAWFIVAMITYAVIRYCRYAGFQLPEYINSYLTDLLCMPIILFICLAGVKIIKRKSDIVLTPLQVFIVTLEFIVLFEVILPHYSTNYTSDWVDAIGYGIGAATFWLLNRNQKSISTTTVSNSVV